MTDWKSGWTTGGVRHGDHPVTESERRNDLYDGDHVVRPIAFLIPAGCLVVLFGALIAGLALHVGSNPEPWKLRVKVVALSGPLGAPLRKLAPTDK